jgi:hypothetical protein
MPAFVKSNVGSSTGTHGEDGQKVCPFAWKNSKKVVRTLAMGHLSSFVSSSEVILFIEEKKED